MYVKMFEDKTEDGWLEDEICQFLNDGNGTEDKPFVDVVKILQSSVYSPDLEAPVSTISIWYTERVLDCHRVGGQP